MTVKQINKTAFARARAMDLPVDQGAWAKAARVRDHALASGRDGEAVIGAMLDRLQRLEDNRVEARSRRLALKREAVSQQPLDDATRIFAQV